jgi:hypothetical protein
MAIRVNNYHQITPNGIISKSYDEMTGKAIFKTTNKVVSVEKFIAKHNPSEIVIEQISPTGFLAHPIQKTKIDNSSCINPSIDKNESNIINSKPLSFLSKLSIKFRSFINKILNILKRLKIVKNN